MGMFSSISNNAQQGLNQAQAVAGRPNIGIAQPGYQDPGIDIGFGYRDLPGNQPGYNPVPEQMPTPQPAQTPGGFQTTFQQLGYSSLEAMKDALDPGWRTSTAQIGFGPVPQPEQQPQMQQPIFQPPAMQMPMPQQQPQMQQPISQPQMQMPPGLPTGSAPGGKSATPGDNFSPGSNYRQAPGQRPGVEIGSPGGLMPAQTPAQFTGGLRPAPSNFRPPRRPGGNLRQRTRR